MSMAPCSPRSLCRFALLLTSPALAKKGKLRERLIPEVMKVVFPAEAERLGPEEGSPPAIALYQGDNHRLCILDPRYHRGSRLFDDAVRRDRRRRPRRPHHLGQGGVPQRTLYRPRSSAPAPARHFPRSRGRPTAARRALLYPEKWKMRERGFAHSLNCFHQSSG